MRGLHLLMKAKIIPSTLRRTMGAGNSRSESLTPNLNLNHSEEANQSVEVAGVSDRGCRMRSATGAP